MILTNCLFILFYPKHGKQNLNQSRYFLKKEQLTVTKALLTNETGKKNKNEKKGTTYLNKKKKLKENEKRTDDK